MGSQSSTSPSARVTRPARASNVMASPSSIAQRVRAGQQQQADVEGIAEIEARVRGRHHRRHAQVHQHRCGLLARGADAEPGTGDEDVAAPHVGSEFGAHALQAVACHDVEAVLHRVAGRELIGVDVGRQAPGPHARISRASLMRPRRADAATVYGEPRNTCAVAAPMRPLKLRAVLEMTLTPSPIAAP